MARPRPAQHCRLHGEDCIGAKTMRCYTKWQLLHPISSAFTSCPASPAPMNIWWAVGASCACFNLGPSSCNTQRGWCGSHLLPTLCSPQGSLLHVGIKFLLAKYLNNYWLDFMKLRSKHIGTNNWLTFGENPFKLQSSRYLWFLTGSSCSCGFKRLTLLFLRIRSLQVSPVLLVSPSSCERCLPLCALLLLQTLTQQSATSTGLFALLPVYSPVLLLLLLSKQPDLLKSVNKTHNTHSSGPKINLLHPLHILQGFHWNKFTYLYLYQVCWLSAADFKF